MDPIEIEWLRDPNNIYVGRGTVHLEASKWGNPYLMVTGCSRSRSKVIRLYKVYIQENAELLNSIYELVGKRLGCWCSPQRCHAEILHLLAGNIPVYQKY